MKKRVFAMALATLFIIGALSACGSKDNGSTNSNTSNNTSNNAATDNAPAKANDPAPAANNDPAPAAATGLKGDITFAFWDGNQQAGMQALADAFMKANPDVNITLSVTPWGEYWQVLSAAAAGAMPDVFWMHSNNFVDFAKKGILVDCTGLFDPNNYPIGISQVFKWDGKQLGIPKDFDTIAIAYNKTLFDQAGVDYPNGNWSWDDFIAAAQKLTSGDVYGFAASAGEDQSGYLLPIYQSGGYTVKMGDKTSGYTDPKTIRGIQWYVDCQTKYKVSPTQQDFGSMDPHGYFHSGKLAMNYLGSWNIRWYTDAMKELGMDWDLAEPPKGPDGTKASIYNGLTYAGYKDSKNPEIVNAFLTFLGSKEAAEIMGKTGAAIPAFNGTQDSWSSQFAGLNVKVYPDMISYSTQYPFSATKAQWGDSERNAIAELYGSANPDIAGAMAKLKAEVDALLATE